MTTPADEPSLRPQTDPYYKAVEEMDLQETQAQLDFAKKQGERALRREGLRQEERELEALIMANFERQIEKYSKILRELERNHLGKKRKEPSKKVLCVVL